MFTNKHMCIQALFNTNTHYTVHLGILTLRNIPFILIIKGVKYIICEKVNIYLISRKWHMMN